MTQPSLLEWKPKSAPKGETFDKAKDGARLLRQLDAVWGLMRDGKWRGLADIALLVRAPEASVSARLREIRKSGLSVERERAGAGGRWLYRVIGRTTQGAEVPRVLSKSFGPHHEEERDGSGGSGLPESLKVVAP